MKKIYFSLFYVLFSTAYAQSTPDISKKTTPDSGLTEWKLVDEHFQLQLVQRSPDQTRSFFEARGFDKNITNQIANSCVFQTIIHNTSSDKNQNIHIALKNWKIKLNNTTQGIKLKEQWDKEWENKPVKQSSRIAFRWATFPSEQTFEPSGDYNWGMISFGPSPEQSFDLNIIWESNQKKHSVWIKDIVCPKDK